jgi:hypothetical protein
MPSTALVSRSTRPRSVQALAIDDCRVGNWDERSPVMGDCHAGICGSTGVRSLGRPDLSSGSYIPRPVRAVQIPKKDGQGVRSCRLGVLWCYRVEELVDALSPHLLVTADRISARLGYGRGDER